MGTFVANINAISDPSFCETVLKSKLHTTLWFDGTLKICGFTGWPKSFSLNSIARKFGDE